LGGGAELAYDCDIRVASTRATFGQPDARFGITAAPGCCFRLPAIVGDGMARDLLVTDCVLRADEARACGLVARLVEPHGLLETARQVCDDMLRSSQAALRMTKLALHAGPDVHAALELTAQAFLFETKRNPGG
jgi:enoyl-CoA hydratase/carnithine racemase